MLKLLFADDQIPDDAIPDESIRDTLRNLHPDWPIGFINAFVVMRDVVKTLRDGCEVTVANSVSQALSHIERTHFDVAIVDLGWYADEEVPDAERGSVGWKIAEAIDNADSRHLDRMPTAQIVYSARFVDHPEISITAASKGKLPFFKPYGERYSIPSPEKLGEEDRDATQAARQALNAAVSFIEHMLTSTSPDERQRRADVSMVRDAVIDGWRNALEQQRRWYWLTIVLVGVGVGLVFLGAFGAFFLGFEEGVVTTIGGAVVAVISRLLFAQLREARKEIHSARDVILNYLGE